MGGDVCCKYILLTCVNKEAAFSQYLNRVKSGGKRYIEKVDVVRKKPYNWCQRQMTSLEPTETLPVGQEFLVMHSIKEKGYLRI